LRTAVSSAISALLPRTREVPTTVSPIRIVDEYDWVDGTLAIRKPRRHDREEAALGITRSIEC
jgi:hypothetical protein